DDIIVINKPNGIASQGGTNIVAGIDYMTSSCCDTYLVHRLDKETAGIMVLTKNYSTSRKLSEMFVNGLIKKTYYALLCNVPKSKSSVVNAALMHDGRKVCVDITSGKKAITEYSLISSYGGMGLVMLSPKTGRKHQIRVHMSYIGCPIIGDF
uniref:Pseudouridine synthase RsuA/RluA-like domain-containing protein n=1 Tax=Biomphalaria glabrata TaxID=6526 RepID=A0A2C9LQA1_BIOGL